MGGEEGQGGEPGEGGDGEAGGLTEPYSFSAFLRAFSSFGIKPPTSSDHGFLI